MFLSPRLWGVGQTGQLGRSIQDTRHPDLQQCKTMQNNSTLLKLCFGKSFFFTQMCYHMVGFLLMILNECS